MDKTLLILAYGSKAESTTEVIYSEDAFYEQDRQVLWNRGWTLG